MTDKELKMLLNKKRSDVQELSEKLQIELTDYSRDHLIKIIYNMYVALMFFIKIQLYSLTYGLMKYLK